MDYQEKMLLVTLGRIIQRATIILSGAYKTDPDRPSRLSGSGAIQYPSSEKLLAHELDIMKRHIQYMHDLAEEVPECPPSQAKPEDSECERLDEKEHLKALDAKDNLRRRRSYISKVVPVDGGGGGFYRG